MRHTDEEIDQFRRTVLKPRNFDILVTTYEGAKKMFNYFSRIHWEVLAVDEAHKIKNSES